MKTRPVLQVRPSWAPTALSLAIWLAASPVGAAGPAPKANLAPASPTESAEVAQLKARVAALEENAEQQSAQSQADAKDSWTQKIQIHGLVEVDGVYSSPEHAADSSDLYLGTVELGVTAKPNDWVEGEITLYYEEGYTGVDVDVAKIRIGNAEVTPGYLDVGRMYVPFGRYETQMLSDPLTLNLGETREEAFLVGFESSGFYGAGYLFNGDTQDRGEDHIEHFGADLGYKHEAAEDQKFDVGASWISSLGDSDGIWDAGVLVNPVEYVSGVSVHANGAIGPVTLSGEYVTATNNLQGAGSGTKAAAWAVEGGYTFDVMARDTTVALGFQGTEEAAFLSQPKNRTIGAVSVDVIEHLSVGLEWARDEDYAGDQTDTATARLSLEM